MRTSKRLKSKPPRGLGRGRLARAHACGARLQSIYLVAIYSNWKRRGALQQKPSGKTVQEYVKELEEKRREDKLQ